MLLIDKYHYCVKRHRSMILFWEKLNFSKKKELKIIAIRFIFTDRFRV